jgi:hypothetical protein
MVPADAVVVYHNDKEPVSTQFHAEDYWLSGYSQCSGSLDEGVCPDSVYKSDPGNDDVKIISQECSREGLVTNFVFTRPLKASDSMRDISLDQEVNIFGAIGKMNPKQATGANAVSYTQIFKHDPGDKTSSSASLKFNAKSTSTKECKPEDDVTGKEKSTSTKYEAWAPACIEKTNKFVAEIGWTGGEKGYKGITGSNSWGISWWLNEKLIPEICLEKGETYTFEVFGGNDPTTGALYHPFYITDDKAGGYGQKNKEERDKAKVYAGVNLTDKANPKPTAVGKYCEWKSKDGEDKWMNANSFEEYKKGFKKECSGSGNGGIMKWKVPEDLTSGTTLYYQCYTHNYLGWKIHIIDKGDKCPCVSSAKGTRNSVSSTVITIFVIMLHAFLF